MRMFEFLFGILVYQSKLGICDVYLRPSRIALRSSGTEKPLDEANVKNPSDSRLTLIDHDIDTKKSLPVSNIADNFYYVDPILKGDFHEAWYFCKEYSMESLSVDDSSELQNIAYFLTVQNNGKFDKTVSFYTSGKRLRKAGFWMWMNSGKHVDRGITIEDNMVGDCIVLEHNFITNEAVLKTTNCDAELHVICKSKKVYKYVE